MMTIMTASDRTLGIEMEVWGPETQQESGVDICQKSSRKVVMEKVRKAAGRWC
ncbi:MAG: hypothetical protein K5683_00865 [Prevotella sp.]|nr:hypothetical protein [Prevotella sp.]